MGCDTECFDDGARVTDGKGARLVFHFAGSGDLVTLSYDEWAYDQARKTDIAKWQIFMDGDRISHIVNMDNVTFIEVMGDEC